MKLNLFKTSLVSAALLASAATTQTASADAGFSANASAQNFYFWRGTDYTEGAALQGGIDFDTGVGIYLGTWTSNIDTADGGSGNEIDYYVGYALEAGDFYADLSYIYYHYTQGIDSYGEYILTLGYDFGGADVSILLDQAAHSSIATYEQYYEVNVGIPLTDSLDLGLTYGIVPGTGDGNDSIVTEDSSFSGISLSKPINDTWTASAMYVLPDDEANGGYIVNGNRRVIVTIGADF